MVASSLEKHITITVTVTITITITMHNTDLYIANEEDNTQN